MPGPSVPSDNRFVLSSLSPKQVTEDKLYDEKYQLIGKSACNGFASPEASKTLDYDQQAKPITLKADCVSEGTIHVHSKRKAEDDNQLHAASSSVTVHWRDVFGSEWSTQVPRSAWQPDGDAARCGCGAIFGILVRRHHCRHCGRLVCAACSNHRVVLRPTDHPDSDERSRSRVCDPCFHILQSVDASSHAPPQQQELLLLPASTAPLSAKKTPPPSLPGSLTPLESDMRLGHPARTSESPDGTSSSSPAPPLSAFPPRGAAALAARSSSAGRPSPPAQKRLTPPRASGRAGMRARDRSFF